MQTFYPDVFVNSEDFGALSLPHGELTVQIAPLWWSDTEQSFDLMPLLQLRERAPHLHFWFDYKLGYGPTGSRYDYRWAYELPEHEQSWIGMSPEQLWNMPAVCDHSRSFSNGTSLSSSNTWLSTKLNVSGTSRPVTSF
jgi:hypothetical protein